MVGRASTPGMGEEQIKRENPRRAVELAQDLHRKSHPVGNWFAGFCSFSAQVMGSAYTFIAAIALIVVWGITGPYYHYSDTWQLIINTATNLITFVMVFLIQNTQNRDAKAINLKLNEVIHALKHAHNEMIDIEKLSDEELTQLDKHYERIRKEAERRNQVRGQAGSKGPAA